jgi:hypothetical protein
MIHGADNRISNQGATALSTSEAERIREETRLRFLAQMDIRFDPERKAFVHRITLSNPMPSCAKGVGDAKLESELRFSAWQCLSAYGLRMPAASDLPVWVREEQIRIESIAVDPSTNPNPRTGPRFEMRFTVRDPLEPETILTRGTLGFYRTPDIVQYVDADIEVGRLKRTSKGFPGISFANAFVGGRYEAAEKAAIMEEMRARGLIVDPEPIKLDAISGPIPPGPEGRGRSEAAGIETAVGRKSILRILG